MWTSEPAGYTHAVVRDHLLIMLLMLVSWGSC